MQASFRASARTSIQGSTKLNQIMTHPFVLGCSFSSKISTVDSLIIGSGVAGASCALSLAKRGLKSVVLTAAANAIECNSAWAQGGIIYKAQDDSPDLLAQDVHYAGAGLCNPTAVMHLATAGPGCVEEILLSAPVQVPFDRDSRGELALCLEASHNRARIIHWRDQTGLAITSALLNAMAHDDHITTLHSRTATDLVLDSSGRCIGARVFNALSECEELILSPNTVLAAGGLGEIYKHTSNHISARGDGLALAHRAGARLSALEYVQFHPTTFFLPGERSFLLTEALRGEGARLRNKAGHAFAKDYHALGELAPRDVVSRMIVAEMRRTGADHVLLDISHREVDWVRTRFPAIYQHCLSKGFDMTRVSLPVVPAAHYFCGGVDVDLDGQTSVPGLFAAGEVSCTGLHGGNRLASTSLLEGLVWGRAAAHRIDTCRTTFVGTLPTSVPFTPRRLTQLSMSTQARLARLWAELQGEMWRNVGIVRSLAGLSQAETALASIAREVAEMQNALEKQGRFHPQVSGLTNAVLVATLISTAAKQNPTSRGAHFRSDDDGHKPPS